MYPRHDTIVSHKSRYKEAESNGSTENVRFVHVFLTGRSMSVPLGDAVGGTSNTSRGVPQGSALCPVVFSPAAAVSSALVFREFVVHAH